jgi:PIN domain nuclease of toxin-antitoxin system
MRVLLDTVSFIWALQSPELLSAKAMMVLQDEKTVREFSTISISEIAIKRAKGKLEVSRDDVITGIADLKLRVISYSAEHAYQLFSLPILHLDLFDRQIVAQALVEKNTGGNYRR